MNTSCPHCNSNAVRKNGSIHTGKQKYECLSCRKQFVENPQNKIIPDDTDEMWSFIGNKKNDQWLWLVLHSATRQILAFHVGKRDKASGEALMAKLPTDLKKSPLLHR